MSALLFTLTALALFAQNDLSFDEFFAQFAKKRDEIRVMTARFRQTTVTPDDIVVSEGGITYANPKRLVLRYADPEMVFLNDGVRLYQYDSETRQLEIYDIGDRPDSEAFFLGFESDPAKLREAYTVNIYPRPSESGVAFVIELKPRDTEDALFQRVILSLRPGDLLPVEIVIVNDDTSEVNYKLVDFVINGAIDPRDTQIFLPEGTMVLDNEDYVETVGPGGKWVTAPHEAAREP
jgi:outer membrane lipoprotein-sorting protein